LSFFNFFKIGRPRLFIAVLALTIGTQLLGAQAIREYDLEMQEKHAEQKGYDPNYRVNYFENIIIRSTFSANQNNLQFVNRENGNAVDLSPAAENLVGFSVDYKWIALGVSFAPQFLISTEDKALLESSQTIKLNLNFFYSDRWRQELSYVYSKGFRVTSNFDLMDSQLDALRNTELSIFQGSTFFIANKNYSFRAHYAQTERQLKSAGSLIPRLSYAYSVINPSTNNLSPDSNATSKIESYDLMGSLGYLYTFVHNKKWLATLGLHAGAGYNNSSYDYNNNTNSIFKGTSFILKGEITLGYNSYRCFYGINGFWQNFYNANNQNNELNKDSAFFMIYLGYRFNDNKPMRKFFGWFEDKFGF
jgi:hypothetical protein